MASARRISVTGFGVRWLGRPLSRSVPFVVLGSAVLATAATIGLGPTLAVALVFLTAFLLTSVLIIAAAPARLRLALVFAMVLRFGAALVDQLVVQLPLSGEDTVWFQQMALGLMSTPAMDIILELPTGSALWYTLIALFYQLVGVNELGLALLLAFLSFLTVRVVAAAADDLGGGRAALLAAWLFALMPMQIVISAATLREAVIVLVAALAVRAISRYGAHRPVLGVAWSTVSVMIAGFLHTGMLGALLGPFWLGLEQARRKRFVYATAFVAGFSILISAVVWIERTGAGLDYVGGSLSNVDLDLVTDRNTVGARGGLAYLSGVQPDTPLAYGATLPLRSVYFWFAPFPWHVRVVEHLLGLVDAVILFGLALIVARGRRTLFGKLAGRALIALILGFMLVYAAGVSNAGTAIRHRHKAVPALVVLAAVAAAERRTSAAALARDSVTLVREPVRRQA